MAQDADGGSSWSANVSVTVQGPNSPPAVNLTSPANGAKFPAPATISLTATATDADGPIDRVEFFSGTTLLGADTSQPYSFTWSNVPAGLYNLRAVVYDPGGQGGFRDCRRHRGRHELAADGDADEPRERGDVYRAGHDSARRQASDAEGPIAKVEFYSGAALLWVENLTPYADSWTNVPAGPTLTAVAYHGQGAKTTSAPVTVTVKGPNGAPTVALTSPANGLTLTAPATFNLAANASNPGAPSWRGSPSIQARRCWRPTPRPRTPGLGAPSRLVPTR